MKKSIFYVILFGLMGVNFVQAAQCKFLILSVGLHGEEAAIPKDHTWCESKDTCLAEVAKRNAEANLSSEFQSFYYCANKANTGGTLYNQERVRCGSSDSGGQSRVSCSAPSGNPIVAVEIGWNELSDYCWFMDTWFWGDGKLTVKGGCQIEGTFITESSN